MEGVIIRTERLILRSLTENDVGDDYLNWFNNTETAKNIKYSEGLNIEKLKAYVAERQDQDDALLLGIFLKNNNKHVGNIKYEPINFFEKYAVMGILIGDIACRGKGIAPEAIKSSSSWLRDNFGISCISLSVGFGNDRAIRAYEKIGFKKDMDAPFVSQIYGFGMLLKLDE